MAPRPTPIPSPLLFFFSPPLICTGRSDFPPSSKQFPFSFHTFRGVLMFPPPLPFPFSASRVAQMAHEPPSIFRNPTFSLLGELCKDSLPFFFIAPAVAKASFPTARSLSGPDRRFCPFASPFSFFFSPLPQSLYQERDLRKARMTFCCGSSPLCRGRRQTPLSFPSFLAVRPLVRCGQVLFELSSPPFPLSEAIESILLPFGTGISPRPAPFPPFAVKK